jgi:YidC/Oxa1 family membrane protein insertase
VDIFSFGPIAAVLDATYGLVTGLSGALAPVAGTLSGLLAVVVLTVLVRALLIPVGMSQVRA